MGSTANKGRRDLSDAEFQDRKKKGLCYKCDERYFVGHNCKNKELQVFTVLNGCEVELVDGYCVEDVTDSGEEAPEFMGLSLNAFLGVNTPATTKLRGRIGNSTFVVMLDSGATHNFITPAAVKKAKLRVLQDTDYEVMLGTGASVRSIGCCRHVKFELSGIEFEADFISLELGSADLILGIQWLRTLGPCQMNWDTHELSFVYQQQRITLCGNTDIPHQSVLQGLISEYRLGKNVLFLEEEEVSLHGLELSTEFSELLDKYKVVFDEPTTLPPVRGREHAIFLEAGAGPISVRPYRYAHAHTEEMERLVRIMLESGIIRPSHSPYSNPMLLVQKKDESWRFCVDYRALNRVNVADKFPIPMIDQLLDELHGAVIFSKFDLRAGYHQIQMLERDIEKTAFRTHDGHYEFLVMPFGLTNAPATFQSLMNEVFRPYLRKFILVFFDDILIYSPDLDSHLRHVEMVMQILLEHQLFANKKKCSFAQPQIEYLGHIVTGEGVKTDESKIAAMAKWPVPKNVKALRGFLGLTGYYRRFVRGYGVMARPLTRLLQKTGFEWCEKAQVAFDSLKTAMSTAPVLALPNFEEMFIVESDASGFGLGAVLMQNQNPLAYFSYGLTEKEKLKPVYERELMAIVMAILKWRHYLLGRKFLVRTDQRSLKYLLEQREVTMEYQRWLTKLLGFDFDIMYKPGSENTAADGLSRVKMEGIEAVNIHLFALTVPAVLQMEDIYREVDQSAEVLEIGVSWKKGSLVKQGSP